MHERLARGITFACHEARALRAIDKADNAVVAQHKRLRELTDRRPVTRIAAAHREQELMLRWRETMLLGALLAPMQKPAQASTQLQELRVLLLGQIIMHTKNISHHDIVERFAGATTGGPTILVHMP